MSPVHRGQHMLKRDEQGREVRLVDYVLCHVPEAITMKRTQNDEKHYIERKNMPRYMR
jgi:hypothetical protein